MEILRTFDIVSRMLSEFPKEDALAVKRNGNWDKFSTADYRQLVDNFGYGLLKLGISKGDKIFTISNNRPEWNIMDMGMSQIGAVHVPVYPNNSDEEYSHILAHSDARFVIVSSQLFFDRIKPLADKTPNIEKIFTIDTVQGAANINEIFELGAQNQDQKKLEEIKATISGDDLVSIIYTSGTTGVPKGVMLSHTNFLSNVKASTHLLPVDHTGKFLSFLPLCHVFERMVNYLLQYQGVSVYYAESIDTIGDNLREVSPDGFASVPRVIEKLYDKLLLTGRGLKGIKKGIFFWAVNIGLRYELNRANGAFYEFKRKIADKLVYSKWREALGNNIKVVVSGGAALQPRLARVFNCAGVKIQEGYGLTETSPVIAVNHADYPDMRFGTVGPVLDNVEVKIADDGEIVMRGPSLMMGYYKDPERTAEVIDSEGWFHTGDIGELQDRRILKITDRKKEIFKLSTGKYVAPQVIENIFKESQFIEQIMVVGAGEKFTAAIIGPSFHFLNGWAFLNKVKYRDSKELIKHPRVIERYKQEIDRINENLNPHEQIKQFELTCTEWTPESGELSPTLKLRRNIIKAKYKVLFDRIYGYTEQDGHLQEPIPNPEFEG
ncbi:MAG: long-chain fatty acid--CoA ligase [Bacteroidales bacterium]|jgi:long-chain acyl-CoA synthetase|nr:long-chain fatty acid--CoA ligase [Bacteroidales bacterium]MCK9447765.1 long-chain fatty acid--CoA ligase [Bacteroidales bacterium]MDD3700128.1 long-chain fatty acid--CoA ligase [Bacteroidales bacterium]MDY0369048.1 long-chain fatty acid--CoA ligase [Bacteroidales bacterium]